MLQPCGTVDAGEDPLPDDDLVSRECTARGSRDRAGRFLPSILAVVGGEVSPERTADQLAADRDPMDPTMGPFEE